MRHRPERNFVPAVARRYGATGPARGRLTPDTPLGRIPLAAAVGFNARALGEPGDDALALYVKSDAMWVGTKSARTSDMVATQGDVTRVRLTLEERFVHRHHWRAGDLVMWDNRCTMHTATVFDATRYRRLLNRTIVA